MAPLLQEMEQFTELLRRKSRLKHYLDSVTTQKLELKRESGVTTLIEMSSNTRKKCKAVVRNSIFIAKEN